MLHFLRLGRITKQFRSDFFHRGIDFNALNKEFIPAIGIRDGRFPLRLQNDLDFLGSVGLNDATAGTDAVFLRGCSFYLESNAIASGVGELHGHRDVLTKLESAKMKRGWTKGQLRAFDRRKIMLMNLITHLKESSEGDTVIKLSAMFMQFKT